jgi:hypothetical protein
MLTWHCIDEERDDESFMKIERVLYQNMSVLETEPW